MLERGSHRSKLLILRSGDLAVSEDQHLVLAINSEAVLM